MTHMTVYRLSNMKATEDNVALKHLCSTYLCCHFVHNECLQRGSYSPWHFNKALVPSRTNASITMRPRPWPSVTWVQFLAKYNIYECSYLLFSICAMCGINTDLWNRSRCFLGAKHRCVILPWLLHRALMWSSFISDHDGHDIFCRISRTLAGQGLTFALKLQMSFVVTS